MFPVPTGNFPSGVYHARVRHGGKLYRESLKVKDLALAKR